MVIPPLSEDRRRPLPEKRSFRVEYARSGASKCSGCFFPIALQELRIGTVLPSETGEFDLVRWRHVACMKQYMRIYGGPTKVTQNGLLLANKRGGIESVTAADRKTVEEVFNIQFFASKQDEVIFDEQKAEMERVEKLVSARFPGKALNELFEACVPSLASSPPVTRTGAALSSAEKLSCIVDAITFGKLRACTDCTLNSWLSVSSSGGYQCNGHHDEFTACTFRSVLSTHVEREDIVKHLPPSAAAKLKPLLDGSKAAAPRMFLSGLTRNSSTLEESGRVLPCPPLQSRDMPRSTIFDGLVILVAKEVPDRQLWIEAVLAHGGQTDLLSKSNSGRCGGPPPMVLIPDSSPAEAIQLEYKREFPQVSFEFVTVKFIKAALQQNVVPHPLDLPRTGLTIDTSFIVLNGPALDEKELSRIAENEQKKASQMTEESSSPNGSAAGTSGGSSMITEKSKKKVFSFRGRVPVDPECSQRLPSTGEVVMSAGGKPYSFSLASADVVSDKNKFYISQIVKDESSVCYLFRRWGRVGDAVRNGLILKPMEEFGAREEFEKLFLEKTGNVWNDGLARNSAPFKKHPGKMVLVGTEGALDLPPPTQTISSSLAKEERGTVSLPEQTTQLLKKLFDTEILQTAMSEMSIDVKKLPVGSLRQSTLDAGKSLLQQALKVLEDQTTSKSQNKNNDKMLDLEAKRFTAKLTSLTNQFYSSIPHAFDEAATGERLSDFLLLNTPEKIAAKYALLDDLKDIALTQQIVTSSASAVDPNVANYRALQLEVFDAIPPSSDEFTMVNTYLTHSHGRTHSSFKLLHLWKIQRLEDRKRFNPNALGNRKLLWHGSRLTNWVRILQQGLRIAPPEAPSTGYMFGKGVYFADMFTKSANYCHFGTKGVNTGLLALAEVALGTPTERTQSDFIVDLPRGTHSCYARGGDMPDPAGDAKWSVDPAVTVPLGRAIQTNVCGSLLYNEYIVYNVNQIQMHYLLEVAPKYA